MNQNILLIGLLIGALFFLRRQPTYQEQMGAGSTGIPGIPGTTGMYGEG
jgi:hypothetical protein